MKTVSESRTIKSILVQPPDTNMHGTIFGGRVLALIDEVGAISAMRHSQQLVVTASIDSVHFYNPARLGDILTLEAFVTWTGNTSMEVFVRVTSENLSSHEKTLTTTSFLTFVAIDENGKAVRVPKIVPETDEEKHLYETAPTRKKLRFLSRRQSESEKILKMKPDE